uniref:Uncharacterized protein n=1 Tax=Trichogramma kaykai TaxID=54128 RepID=A0ABD2WA38_9HYME
MHFSYIKVKNYNLLKTADPKTMTQKQGVKRQDLFAANIKIFKVQGGRLLINVPKNEPRVCRFDCERLACYDSWNSEIREDIGASCRAREAAATSTIRFRKISFLLPNRMRPES